MGLKGVERVQDVSSYVSGLGDWLTVPLNKIGIVGGGTHLNGKMM